MKRFYLLLSLITCLVGKTCFSQNKLCVCFEKGNPFITIERGENTNLTAFSIIKKEYETEESRKEAMKKYRAEVKKHPVRSPIFYINYVATKEPVKLNSLKKNDCTGFVSLKEFRESGFKRPPNTRSNLFIFIQKNSENEFLKWEVLQRAIE